MKHRRRLFSVFCLLCWAAAAFPAASGFAAADRASSPAITVEKKSQGITWILTTPARPGVAQVSLVLRDAAGNPVQGKVVTGDVRMPDMQMEGYPLELQFAEDKDGRYVALVQYGHGGYWQIRATFGDDDGRVLRQSFDFDIGQ
ncbi:MAG: FixH family protein [Desulfovibrio sp.]|nr:FixH family protein [Desulfovibrio sp.]